MGILKKLLWLAALAVLLVGCAPTIQPAATEPAPAPTPVPVDQAEGVDLRIEIEETFVASALQEQLAEPIAVPGQPGVEVMLADPQFDLVPTDLARLTTTINADVYGVTVEVRPTISLGISAVDGQIQVKIAGVSLGDVQFPLDAIESELSSAEATVQAQLAGALEQVTSATGLSVRNLLVTDDALVVDLGR